MANLKGNIKKYRRGEISGYVSTAFCGAVLIYFAVCFALARTQEIKSLELATLISAPLLMAAGAALAAFCNIKYGGALDRAVKQYILDVFVENAALMHPEKKSLSFYISPEESSVSLQVNGYKENIVFDFSEFGKLPLMRKAGIVSEIETRLTVTFIRLHERGSEYTDVAYAAKKNKSKSIFIIKDGSPDKKAYKIYLKNK